MIYVINTNDNWAKAQEPLKLNTIKVYRLTIADGYDHYIYFHHIEDIITFLELKKQEENACESDRNKIMLNRIKQGRIGDCNRLAINQILYSVRIETIVWGRL